jgi:oligopeptidase A
MLKVFLQVNLMHSFSFPQFSNLDVKIFSQQLNEMLQEHLERIEKILQKNSLYTWDNLMRPLEEMDDELERFWFPLSHLHAVVNTPALRECYQTCLPKLSVYESTIGHNKKLFKAVKSLDLTTLDNAQRKIVEDTLLDFKLAGVDLQEEQKQRYEEIQTQLSELSNKFEINVLDSGQAYELHITDENRVKGLPEHALANAAEIAKEKGLPGWILNLEIPCYIAVVTYAEDRSLREEFYRAYVTRASDQGPTAGDFDNSSIMNEILALRHEKARLLGFKNYAELSLATKMADSSTEVINFLRDLNHKSYRQAQHEFQELQQFAAQEHDMQQVEPWDIAYLSEKKKQNRYTISQEELRAYFPLPKVMQGLFHILENLYGLRMHEISGVDTWHPDVTCFQITDSDHQTRGYIYSDLFARQNKRGGAWMDSCQSRRKLSDGSIQIPIATLTCNFAKPAANKPPTLSHDEVLTLFHELGHCLHHVLTKVDYLSASGIHGVEWDAVELPSQFFENWCWEDAPLKLLTEHVEDGTSLPADLLNRLLAAKNFQSAMGMQRQLEFALFDFRIHAEFQEKDSEFIANILKAVRSDTTVVPIAEYNRFQNSFTHIFGGGYAAGYYSYKWAEVLSSDAFARFEEEGIFNQKTGRDFLQQILEVGGAKKAADAFTAFRGREPSVDALLRHNGIGSSQ